MSLEDAKHSYSEDPLEKARSSEEIITVNSKEHLSAYFTLAAAAFGLINDSYQLVLMTMSNVVFKKLYPKEYTPNVATRVSNALIIGAIIGQVLVGIICDRIGRKTAIVGTTLLIVIGAAIGTAAHGAHGSVNGLFWCLTLSRGIAGVGVGGEYPASATSASEAANEKMLSKRGPVFVAVTNLVSIFGGMLPVIVFLIALSAAGENHLNTVWRVCFGVGVVLPLTVFYFRLRMVSTQLYRRGAIKHRVPYWLTFKRYWRSLIGTCGAAFLFSFVSYPNALFSATILASIIHNGDIKRIAEWKVLFTSFGFPGVLIAIAICNKLGRRYTMMLGFSGYVVFGLITGCTYDKITKIIPLFVVVYALMLSCGQVGPGSMIHLVSNESYPTPVRGTLYGLSVAFASTGAAIGTQVFAPIQKNLGNRWTFIIAAICGILGILVTWLCIPDMTGRDLADEDAAFLRYLADNGWEGHVGEDESVTTTAVSEGNPGEAVGRKV